MENIFSVVVIGDPHFKTNNVKEVEILINESIIFSKKIEPDAIIVLGDILDSHEKVNLQLLNKATNWLIELSKIAQTIVLIGNHERINNTVFCTEEHPFYGLKKANIKNLFIIDEPTSFYIDEEKKSRFVACPYVAPGRFQESLDKLRLNIKDHPPFVIFAHQEFKGSCFGNKGDEWSLDKPLVISGHIHEAKELQKNILYPGSPFQHTFGEDENKGIFYITFNSDGSYRSQKKSLKISRKNTIKITKEKLEELDVSKVKNTRFIVDEKPSEDLLDMLSKNGNKIVIRNDVKFTGTTSLGFKDILLSLFNKDEEMLSLYQEVISTI